MKQSVKLCQKRGDTFLSHFDMTFVLFMCAPVGTLADALAFEDRPLPRAPTRNPGRCIWQAEP